MSRAFANAVLGIGISLLFVPPGLGELPSLPVPDTIRAEGVPPVPASVRQALNRYQNIRLVSFQDGLRWIGMYIITRFADYRRCTSWPRFWSACNSGSFRSGC